MGTFTVQREKRRVNKYRQTPGTPQHQAYSERGRHSAPGASGRRAPPPAQRFLATISPRKGDCELAAFGPGRLKVPGATQAAPREQWVPPKLGRSRVNTPERPTGEQGGRRHAAEEPEISRRGPPPGGLGQRDSGGKVDRTPQPESQRRRGAEPGVPKKSWPSWDRAARTAPRKGLWGEHREGRRCRARPRAGEAPLRLSPPTGGAGLRPPLSPPHSPARGALGRARRGQEVQGAAARRRGPFKTLPAHRPRRPPPAALPAPGPGASCDWAGAAIPLKCGC
ncbi:PREDICTED: proline-rich proteoglycan 2-like [Chinchilla lanigera]|uniref:proline-rich proteoglycan 2-like n=1 Tax=Chinchilla lanigera TaxID=34839 RepID=UPI00038EB13A|nr:PREDICTED: proline-rich proteoglycan 2-like [Chinchilla lanigera]